MKVISFFNNKGGVGKTTLTGNIAAYFAIELNKNVLIIDCDPQCNITQFVLGDNKSIQLYWPAKEDKEDLRIKTILDVIQPILDGDATVNKSVRPIHAKTNRFGVDLLPGHPRFSMLEDPLSLSWTELPSGKAGGFRVSNWLKTFLASIEDIYDVVFIDVGPSLGSLNRSVLLSCDYFVAPLGADAFSVLGIRNISRWMTAWIDYYKVSLEQSERLNPGSLDRFLIPRSIPISHGFVGYTLQQYIAKSKGGERRPTAAFERILNDIPDEIEHFLQQFQTGSPNISDLHLGDVPNLYSLVPLAQSVNAPIVALKAKDGLVGNQFNQAANYKDIIGSLAKRISKRIELQ
jgi:cellulose biosynthesis protein BcsQ